jgi:hypothetical protein
VWQSSLRILGDVRCIWIIPLAFLPNRAGFVVEDSILQHRELDRGFCSGMGQRAEENKSCKPMRLTGLILDLKAWLFPVIPFFITLVDKVQRDQK